MTEPVKINLMKRGTKINLRKQDSSSMDVIKLGLNWGMITHTTKQGGFGFGPFSIGGTTKTRQEEVDLDASCVVFDYDGRVVDVISYRKLRNEWISHSGDDRRGDAVDDGNDNEVITVKLSAAPSNVHQVVFFLNSFSGDDFSTIPHATIRVSDDKTVFAQYDVAHEDRFSGCVSMIMAKVVRENGDFRFVAIGEATRDQRLDETVGTISRKYLTI